MTQNEEDKTSAESIKSGQARSTAPVTTRVGRNNVQIDVPALKTLVDTVNQKLKKDRQDTPS
jgi:hypothetical protein